MQPKILFTSPCGPYAKLPVDKDPIDYFYYRNTLHQKVFQLKSFQSWHSLHFLAQNIAVDSVVLENPDSKAFHREVNNGGYTLVAIGFTILLTPKVLEMVQWLKQNHPEIIVVLGGYGTAIFKEPFESSIKLKELADYICFGEGLGFMNALVYDKWKISKPTELRQDLLPSKNSFFRTRIELFKQIILVSGLGCVYGCSFCATSSQFNRKFIPLFSGEALFKCLQEQCRKYPKVQSAVIYQEDFLLDKRMVLEFKQHFEQSSLRQKAILLTVFASVKSIQQYTMEELIACGIGTIFIGVESFNEQVISGEGLTKRTGEVEALFSQLHLNGINTLGSLIIGWDGQTKEIAQADSKRFVEINPTFYQVVPLHAVPGTKLWEDMKNQRRIPKHYAVQHDGISDFNFKLKHFSQAYALEIISSTYKGMVKEGGPWPFRMFENTLRGYAHLKSHAHEVMANRANVYKTMLFPLCLIAFASRVFFWGRPFKKRWNKAMIEFFGLFPLMFVLSLVLSPFVTLYLFIVYTFSSLYHWLNPKGEQPHFIRREYKTAVDDE